MTVFYQGKAERTSLKVSDLKTVSPVSEVRCLDNFRLLTVALKVGQKNQHLFQEIFYFYFDGP